MDLSRIADVIVAVLTLTLLMALPWALGRVMGSPGHIGYHTAKVPAYLYATLMWIASAGIVLFLVMLSMPDVPTDTVVGVLIAMLFLVLHGFWTGRNKLSSATPLDN